MGLIDGIARLLGWPRTETDAGESDRRRYDRPWWRFDRRAVAPALLGSAMLGPQPVMAIGRGGPAEHPGSESAGRRADRAGRLSSTRLYVAPETPPGPRMMTARDLDPAVLEDQPVAHWFGDWSGDVFRRARRLMEDAATTRSVPVVVAWNLPHRDFDDEGGGGAPDAEAYGDWIRDLARGIGDREAILILEPDALALVSCLTHQARSERFSLLREAVGVLTARTRARVYIDAGHASWVDAEEMAQRLHLAAIDMADGFALNVGSELGTEANIAYGEAVSRRLNGERFVIDTSRNGASDADERFGRRGIVPGLLPALETGHPMVDAFLWVDPAGRGVRAARSA